MIEAEQTATTIDAMNGSTFVGAFPAPQFGVVVSLQSEPGAQATDLRMWGTARFNLAHYPIRMPIAVHQENQLRSQPMMRSQTRLSPEIQELLCCPNCRAKVKQNSDFLECISGQCAARYPVIDGIPVLINEQSSIFRFDDFVSHRKTFFANIQKSSLKATIQSLVPKIGKNIKGRANYKKLGQLLLANSEAPRVLVVGGSILGQGMESLEGFPAIELVETDVSFGPRTALICDAHDIPFHDRSFDGVIVQAVMEHVVDPYRCSEEIHRVLKPDGIVYAETPFMQQVHGGRYDFTRFTHLGHRRLFRKFEEIESGAVCGPGMALAWSYEYFLMSFVKSRVARKFVHLFASLTGFHLKYFDHLVINMPGTLDAASGYYFLGRKSVNVLSDRELIAGYRGAGG